MTEIKRRVLRTILGDEITTEIEKDASGRYVEKIEIETPLSLVRDPKATPDTGRNWERH